MNRLFYLLINVIAMQFFFTSCSSPTSDEKKEDAGGQSPSSKKYTEGSDYLIFERVRMLDKTGFASPQEAYSILLPKGWSSTDDIIWNAPGSSCAGTFRQLTAKSADGKYLFEMLPDVIFSWNTNAELMQFNQNNKQSSSYCDFKEPMGAEQYLRNVFVNELGNPQIIKVESNQAVVDQMRQWNEESSREIRQYGAGQIQFSQTAVNADLTWPDGTAGWVVLGVTVVETVVPNVYNGSYDKIFNTQITKRTVFKYPADEKEQAKNKFGTIFSSFRTSQAWNDAVNKFWKDVRQKKNIAHIGRIRIMDEQTRQIGERATRAGAERLKNMDNEMRSWEQRQRSDDRIHTNFIKAIREVENYSDESGKYEVAAGYDHVWSRGDGSSFVLSNSPNFDPGFVFQDQNWKEMKKVE
ncbi:MAG: hypothetical protein ACKVOW_01815 [Chitinophagaceae bacterium]